MNRITTAAPDGPSPEHNEPSPAEGTVNVTRAPELDGLDAVEQGVGRAAVGGVLGFAVGEISGAILRKAGLNIDQSGYTLLVTPVLGILYCLARRRRS